MGAAALSNQQTGNAMLFNITLILAVAVFVVGLGLSVRRWLRVDPAGPAGSSGPAESRPAAFGPAASGRGAAALKGVFASLFGRRAPVLAKTLVTDVLVQTTTLRQSRFRWLAHQFIWLGFVLLVLFHAMDGVISEQLFGDYFPTVNPYYALRDLLGLLALIGALMAAGRRLWAKQPRLKSSRQDWIALLFLIVIIVSGFLLSGMKTTSKQAFDRMVTEYAALDEDEARQLEAYWVSEYGLYSSPLKGPFDQETLEAGAENHDFYCASCHASPRTAPVTYVTALALSPLAGPLDRAGFATLLWYLHFLASFAFLAYLPFGKFLHVFATPLHLLARAGRDETSGSSEPANLATIRALALDACVHCGACSEICAVGGAYAVMSNDFMLPSEKIGLLRRLAAGRPPHGGELQTAARGMVICTNCNRCGDACPAGIDLQPLWAAVRERLLTAPEAMAEPTLLSPLSFYRAGKAEELGEAYAEPRDRAWRAIARHFPEPARLELRRGPSELRESMRVSAQGFSFSSCYNCKTCSSACPVKDQYENPKEELGLLPHQIIHATLLGQADLAARSKMLWACLGCYQCQEQCPQGVAVTDVLYELKHLAQARLAEKGQGSII